MIATSGLVSRIHACDFSKPEKTRFQYGSSVLPLSSAAPIAGTCDEPTPPLFLATAYLPFRCFCFRFGLRLGFDLWLRRAVLCGSAAGEELRRGVLAGPRAVAFDVTAATQH